VEIVGVVKCKPSFKKKISILRSAIKKNSLRYAIYMQLEVLLTKYIVFFSKVAKNNVLSIKTTNLFVTSNLEDQGVLNFVKSCNADLILSIRPSLIFPHKTIVKIPPIVNLHCSKLPSYGGIGAVLQALAADEQSLGISFHLIENHKIDDGLVIYQEKIKNIKNKSVFWHTFMLYYKASVIIEKNFINVYKNALNKTPSYINISNKSYFSWPSKKCFLRLKKNGKKMISYSDLIFWEIF
jgi:methionyl-tRNA formyltransferase